MRFRLPALVVACLLAWIVTPAAQGQSAARLQFEVASVKRNVSGRAGGAIQVPPAGALSFTNVMLRLLIREAYQIDAYAEPYLLDPGRHARIIGTAAGGPQSDVPRFDVRAKPPDNTQPADRRAMMRTLLEDRFKLRVHRETRSVDGYVLTVARPGRLGPNLRPSSFDCNAYLANRRAGRSGAEPVDANGTSWCLAPIDQSRPGVMTLRFAGPINLLVQRVQPYVDRPVVDATGLSTNMEWVLAFAWQAGASDDVPALFTAMQDQLGLKLEPRQTSVDVLVVDSVELPVSD